MEGFACVVKEGIGLNNEHCFGNNLVRQWGG